MPNSKFNISNFLVLIIISALIIFLGFTDNNKLSNPKEVYAVYIDGEKIGVVSSKDKLNEFINKKEEQIKKTYNVDSIYTPRGVDIKKIYTYEKEVNTVEDIYQKLIKLKNFTIKGTVIKLEDDSEEDKKVDYIYVLNKKIFDTSIKSIMKAFVDTESYKKFLANEQDEIIDTGSLIENIDIKEKVTYKEDYIPTSEYIFTNSDDLTRFLLYGTTDKQQTYIVQEGDTIEDVANNNKLNVQEFLIANPEFTSANNLLYASQEVVVGLINPVIDVVVDVHSVENIEKDFNVEVQYDENMVIGYETVEREGEKGLDKVVKKYQYINGQLVDAVIDSSVEVKPSVSKIVVRGDKYVPNVADLSYWGWPTEYPYTITSYFAYRWGAFHSAIDIYVGYGSAIYAANNGTVYQVGTGCAAGNISCNNQRGNYIIINHNAGNYYTQYIHLNSILVKEGQTVSRGQKIATMGNSGYVVPTPSAYSPYSGTHLDFAVYLGIPYRGGTAINPLGLY